MQRASLEALIEEARRFCVGFEELSRLEELVKSAEVCGLLPGPGGFDCFVVEEVVWVSTVLRWW